MWSIESPYLLIFALSVLSCQPDSAPNKTAASTQISEAKPIYVRQPVPTVQGRFPTPPGYERVPVDSTSFAHYLRNLPLKPTGSKVLHYDGTSKSNYDVYAAVVDLPIGNEDLHQCADAVMRLRAEHLWRQGEYERIHFNFTNGMRVDYTEWMQGKRMRIRGNKTWWEAAAAPSNTYDDLWNYLELIFMYAGTASLEKELRPTAIDHARAGDVLIRGGFPGHAVLLIDQARHRETGEMIYLLAQSYMPAQEIQVLINRNDPDLSPWYSMSGAQIDTPEWTFERGQLRRFVD